MPSLARRWATQAAPFITDGHGNYLDGLLDTYRRYTALRREADTVRRASVLL